MDAPTPDALRPPWGLHALEPGETTAVEIGPLTLWLRSEEDELWMAHRSGDWTRRGRERPASPPSLPEDRDWARWPVSGEADELSLAPVLPPRPLVVEPEHSFRLLPRARARVFVRVPLWARTALPGTDGRHLAEVPSAVLSDTWWGTPTEGELCYWLGTTARRQVPPEAFAPNLAVCPLRLTNRSDHELPVERIVLRGDHLSIFADGQEFWSDEARVGYRGAAEGSEVEVSGRPPEEAQDAVWVAAPRESPPSRRFRARTFWRFRDLPGLTGL